MCSRLNTREINAFIRGSGEFTREMSGFSREKHRNTRDVL